jgi:hypothetical protein
MIAGQRVMRIGEHSPCSEADAALISAEFGVAETQCLGEKGLRTVMNLVDFHDPSI